MSPVSPLARELASLRRRIADLERRQENSARHGAVTDVDAEKQLVRLAIGKGPDGTVQKSAWIPYGQFAGALKVHTPPTVGQNMSMFAPGGSIEQAVALPFTWNDDNESPSDKEDENVITYGDVRLTLKEDHIRIEISGVVWKLSGEGFAQAGGGMGHDGQDVGKTHRHPEVMPGPAETGTPVADGPTV